jgi:putative flippase GtrA
MGHHLRSAIKNVAFENKRFINYSVISIVSFILDLSLLWVFSTIFHIHYLVSTGLAFTIAVTFQYIPTRFLVYKNSKQDIGIGYIYFFAIAMVGLLFVTFAMGFLVGIVHLNIIISRVFIAIFVGIWNYILHSYISFREKVF